MTDYLIIFLIVLGLTLITVPMLIKLAFRTGFLDFPTGDPLKIHGRPVPLLGGAAITLAILTGLLFGAKLTGTFPHRSLVAFAGALVGLFGMGLYDDYKGLSPYKRLFGQVAAAVIVVSLGQLSINLFASTLLNDLLTILYLLILINALNLLDGMDGLATGITLIAAAGFLFGFVMAGNSAGILLSAVLLGTTAGFLPYNFAPARIFLGDNGSTVLGFCLGILTILFTASTNSTAQVVVPILILIVPLLDMALTILRRLKRRTPLFLGDREHLYDRLLRSGLTQRQATLLLCGCGMAGLLAATYVLEM